MSETTTMESVVYDLEGTLLEVCTCGVLCPCWVGEDPDGGSCSAMNAYHFDRGTIRGVDVSGRALTLAGFFPNNVLEAGSREGAVYVRARGRHPPVGTVVG